MHFNRICVTEPYMLVHECDVNTKRVLKISPKGSGKMSSYPKTTLYYFQYKSGCIVKVFEAFFLRAYLSTNIVKVNKSTRNSRIKVGGKPKEGLDY